MLFTYGNKIFRIIVQANTAWCDLLDGFDNILHTLEYSSFNQNLEETDLGVQMADDLISLLG